MMDLRFFMILRLFSFAHGLAFVEKVNTESNKEIIDIEVRFENTKDRGFVTNITFQTFEVIEKCTLFLRVNVPAHRLDDACTREFLNTRIDLEKLIAGLHGNFLIKSFVESAMELIKTLNITFPAAPVSEFLYFVEVSVLNQSIRLSQKIYAVYNASMSDTEWIPVSHNTRLVLYLKFLGKVRGLKKNQFLGQVTVLGKITKFYHF